MKKTVDIGKIDLLIGFLCSSSTNPELPKLLYLVSDRMISEIHFFYILTSIEMKHSKPFQIHVNLLF